MNNTTPTTDTVSDYINQNITDIVNLVFPLQNFGFLRNMPTTITMDLHNFLCTILILEYGNYYITDTEKNYFKNTYTTSFWRLLQLMTLDTLVDMQTLLRNNFQSEEYVANVSHSAAINETTGIANETVQGQSTSETQSNSTTDNNYLSGSSDSSTGTGSSEAQTTYLNNSNDNNSSNSTSVVGQSTGINVTLAIPLPEQSLPGSTTQFPTLNGTDVSGVGGVQNLNESYASSAQKVNTFQSSQTNTDQSQGQSTALTNSNTQDTSSNTSTTQAQSESFSDGRQQHIGASNVNDSGTTNVTTETSAENSGKTGTSGFVGSRRKGFTTNAIVATQLYAMLKGYQEIGTALTWWIEQFRWLEPIIGMDKWCDEEQIYV